MEIKISETVIPLEEGTSLPTVLRSPLFTTSDSKIPGSYIFNFSVPAGEEIRRLFGEAQRVQRGGRATAELPYVIISGSLRYQGNCIVTQADSVSYEISCKINNGDFSGKLSGKTLKDLDFGGDRILTNIFSTAYLLNGFMFDREQQGTWTLPLTMIDTIDLDFNSSLSDSGNTFVSNGTYTIKFTSIVHITVSEGSQLYGSIIMCIKKNGTEINSHTINAVGLDKYDYLISVVSGDIIETSFIVHSSVNGPASFFVVSSRVLYQTENLFTSMINSLGDQDNFDFAIFPIHNKDYFTNFPDDAFMLDNTSIKTLYSEYFQVLNYYADGEFPLFLTGPNEQEYFSAANLFTPFLYLKTILKKIAISTGYSLVNNPFDSVYFKNAVLFNAYAENTYTSKDTSIVYVKPTFNLSDHVPAILQGDFLNWISLLTGYIPIVDNNTFTITFIDIKNRHIISNTNPVITFPGILLPNPFVKIDPEYKGIKLELKKSGSDKRLDNIKELNDKLIYKGEVSNIIDLPVLGNNVNDMYLVTEINEYHVFQYDTVTYTLTWVFFSNKFPLIYAEGQEPYLQITTDLSPVLSSYMQDETPGAPLNRFWNLPRTEQAGILEGFPDSFSSEYGTQVLFYKGISLDSQGDPYPLGTCRYNDYSGDPLFFPDLNAESLFTNRWKEFLSWIAYEAKPVTFKVIMTSGQLRQIKFQQIYYGNGFNFLVKEIRVNMLVDGLSIAEMDIYTC
ncbi:MAG: hypothetical protein WCR72_07305 [Bacteroidota bacterium]